MSNRLYTPNEWETGYVITAQGMNNIENGINNISEEIVDASDSYDTIGERLDALN